MYKVEGQKNVGKVVSGKFFQSFDIEKEAHDTAMMLECLGWNTRVVTKEAKVVPIR